MMRALLRHFPASEIFRSRPRAGAHGAAVLPGIIMAAVGLMLIQVPMLFRSHSSEKTLGANKSALSAQFLAEAGIEAAVADIGRSAIRMGDNCDTLAYVDSGLGRGSYSTRIVTRPNLPGIVEILSTGRVGASSQSVRARMALIKDPVTSPLARQGSVCDLNQVVREDLDVNPSTPVQASWVGSTRISGRAMDAIPSPTRYQKGSSGTVLIASARSSRKIYFLNPGNGSAGRASLVSTRGLPATESFRILSLSLAGDGHLYALRDANGFELWRIDSYPSSSGNQPDTATFVSKLPGSGKRPLLTSNPDGFLYALDGDHCFRFLPGVAKKTVTTRPIAREISDIPGAGFSSHFENEKAMGGTYSAKIDSALKLKVISWEAVPGDLARLR